MKSGVGKKLVIFCLVLETLTCVCAIIGLSSVWDGGGQWPSHLLLPVMLAFILNYVTVSLFFFALDTLRPALAVPYFAWKLVLVTAGTAAFSVLIFVFPWLSQDTPIVPVMTIGLLVQFGLMAISLSILLDAASMNSTRAGSGGRVVPEVTTILVEDRKSQSPFVTSSKTLIEAFTQTKERRIGEDNPSSLTRPVTVTGKETEDPTMQLLDSITDLEIGN